MGLQLERQIYEIDTLKSDKPHSDYINIYNNEIIGSIAIFSVLKYIKKVTAAKALFILPLILQRDLAIYLAKGNVNLKSIEQLILKKPELLSNFNERYYSHLKLSLNSILMLKELGFIKITPLGIIKLINIEEEFVPESKIKVIGNRAKYIIKAAPKVANLLEDKVENLTIQLRVKI